MKWANELPLLKAYARVLEEHDVNGPALLRLTYMERLKLMNGKLGPTTNLSFEIEKIKKEGMQEQGATAFLKRQVFSLSRLRARLLA